MSTSTWLIIFAIIALIVYLYIKKYKKEGRREKFIARGGQPEHFQIHDMMMRQFAAGYPQPFSPPPFSYPCLLYTSPSPRDS